MQVIEPKTAREYVLANYPNDPLLKHIALSLLEQLPKVDAVEVSSLGKLGKMMMPYLGCPRGMIGPRGKDGEAKDRNFKILELDPVTDIDGNRWVPVLDSDLAILKDNAQNANYCPNYDVKKGGAAGG